MAGRPSTLRINVTSDSRQARQDIQGVEQQTTGTLSKLKNAGPGLAAAAGAAIGAALMAAVGEALEQGKIKAKLNAQLGATGADAERYGKAAGKLYTAGVTEDFAGAADAIRATMQNLVPAAPGEDLTKLATRAQDLATIMDEDVQSTTRAAAQLLKTGLAKNAEEAFDILTKGAQNGANSSQDLLDTFNEYSTQFRQIGLDGKTALGLITQGLAGGARDSDIVADALKELNLRVRNVNDAAAQGALKKLGLDSKEMAAAFSEGGPAAAAALQQILTKLQQYKGTTDEAALASALLGTQSEDLQQALFALDPSKAQEGLKGLKGASDGVGKSLRDNAGAQLTAFQRTAQQVMVDFIGSKVLPIVQDLVRWYKDNLAPAVSEVARVLREDAVPIFETFRAGAKKVAGTIEDNKDELKTLWTWIKKGLEIWTAYYGFLVSYVFSAISTIIEVISTLVRWLKSAYNWVSNLITALGRIKVPGALGKIIGLVPGLFAAPVPEEGQEQQRTAFGAQTLAATSPAAVFRSLNRSAETPIILNVSIDGQQLQYRIDRTVSRTLNADGARYMAGGYI